MWFTLCLALLVTALAMYSLYERIPNGFSRPWRLRLVLAWISLWLTVGEILDGFGLVSMIDVTNSVLRMATRTNVQKRQQLAKDMMFDGVKVRVYAPEPCDRPESGYLPGLVFYHGGGWALGNTRLYDDFIRPITRVLDIVVVSVEYRLAPAAKFPAPLEDCLTATKFFLTSARDFNVDPDRIAVCGDSAGGNLAAAVCLKLRDEHFRPMPKLQVLVYPVLQSLDYALPSMIQNRSGPLLTTYWLAYYTSLYATGSSRYAAIIQRNRHVASDVRKRMSESYLSHDLLDPQYRHRPYRSPVICGGDEKVWRDLEPVFLDPYFSPLLADDLSRLPETLVYNAYHDVLRDEGLLYVKRLRLAGTPVTHVISEKAIHGICSFRHMFPKEAYEALNLIANYLKAKL